MRAMRRRARPTRRLRFHSRRHVSLFLASNPSGTTRLALRCLDELQPTIIHFSGHGGRGAGHRGHDPYAPEPPRDGVTDAGAGRGPGAGIYLQDQHVSGGALTQMIAGAAPSARLVVLNACFSDEVARSLLPGSGTRLT